VPPDVLLLGTEWPQRALLRAQLIEEGYEVIATDTWPMPWHDRRSKMKPRVVIVDLHGLPEPRDVLDELSYIIEPNRVVVVTALGTLSREEVRRLGYHVVARPARIGDIVKAVASLF
jgi:hypothetical protein